MAGGIAVAVFGLALFATPVWGHALLVSSTPADGSVLGLAPGTVVLNFDEDINPNLSSATVTDPTGHNVTAHPVALREIRIDLLTNAPGRYLTRWVAVSIDDGHTTEGTVAFTVQAGGAGGAGTANAGLNWRDAGIAGLRGAEDLALLTALGLLFIDALARRQPTLDWARVRPRLPLMVAAVAGPAVVAAQAGVAAGGDLGAALAYLSGGGTGWIRLIRIALEWAALLSLWVRPGLLWPLVAAAIVALAASGHAVLNGGIWGVALDTLHIEAAGIWAGGIIAMALLRPRPGGSQRWMPLLERFTPWAIAAFGLTVAAGVGQAALNLGTPAAILGSAYGLVLVVKSALVLAMVPLSVMAWRRRRPRRRTESGIAVAVIVAAALLGQTALPATAAPRTPPGAAGLPRGDVLTLATHAGPVLVGMTISPAKPGRNQITFYLLPPGGTSAAPLLHTGATVNRTPLPITVCGDPCRHGQADLKGGESITLNIAGSGGGHALFRLPSLPAPDGNAVLAAAMARMHRLQTYTLHETLSSGGPALVSDYRAEAPSSLAWVTRGQSGTTAQISIGTTTYSQSRPGAAWSRQTGAPEISEPQFVWESFKPYVGVHIIGSEARDGVRTTVVAFYAGTPATPVWFRLWIDAEGLVRHAQMYAQSHFMEQDFANFDAAIHIVPPSPIAGG